MELEVNNPSGSLPTPWSYGKKKKKNFFFFL